MATLPEHVAQAISESLGQDGTQGQQDLGQGGGTADASGSEAVHDSAEVDAWAARIDAYLASYGAPLAGYGAEFAQAALDYNVDPRLAPAVSVIESGGGKVCFMAHNAWGWGTSSWPDWSSAISGYISSFSTVYGHDFSPEEAEAYASNEIWETWYNLVLSEMASI